MELIHSITSGIGEANPMRPDIPESIARVSDELFDFLRETTENLREQHNLTQAGDSTVNWRQLLAVDVEPRFTLGARGRFYHEDYGLIQARYVKFVEWSAAIAPGSPCGWCVDDSGAKPWQVTNQIEKSASIYLAGIAGPEIAEVDGYYGWVIESGANVLNSASTGAAPAGTLVAWADSGVVGYDASDLGYLLASVADSTIPAGGLYVEVRRGVTQLAASQATQQLAPVQTSLDSVTEAQTGLASKEDQASLQGGYDQLAVELQALKTRMDVAEKNRAQADQIIQKQVTAIKEQLTQLAGVGSLRDLEVAVEQIRNELDQLIVTQQTDFSNLSQSVQEVQTQLSPLPEQVNQLRLHQGGAADFIRSDQVVKVPDGLGALANKVVQVNSTGTGLEPALTLESTLTNFDSRIAALEP